MLTGLLHKISDAFMVAFGCLYVCYKVISLNRKASLQ